MRLQVLYQRPGGLGHCGDFFVPLSFCPLYSPFLGMWFGTGICLYSSDGRTFKMKAMRIMYSNEITRSPRSMRPIYCRLKSHNSPSLSCERSRLCRNFLSCLPNKTRALDTL